jgi:integrase
MGVFSRPDSKYWWLWLETAPKGEQKVRTDILIGATPSTRKASKDDALAVYVDRMTHAGKVRHHLAVPAAAPLTFDAFATWYATHVIPLHRGQVRERNILTRLRQAFGTLSLDDPTWREAVIAWRTTRLAVPLTAAMGRGRRQTRAYPRPSPRTVNREVEFLKQMLTKAVELRHLPFSPLTKLRQLKATPPVRRIMSEDEESRILPHLSVVDRAIVLTGLDTLARCGDILDLKWSDHHGDLLDIRDPKNGVPLQVPISPRLREALAAVPIDPTHPEYIFAVRRRAKTATARHAVLVHALARACRAAGVPYGRTAGGITFHWATRRTGATRMIRRGGEKAIGVVQQIGGWKNIGILVGIYQEVVTAEMRAAVASVAPASPTPGPFPHLVTPAKSLRKKTSSQGR